MTQARALVDAAWEILRESGSVTPAELAQRVGCLPESASNSLRRLWRKGELTRAPAKRTGAPGAQGYVYRQAPLSLLKGESWMDVIDSSGGSYQ